MKNLSFFMLFLACTLGFAQPTTNAPVPTKPAADVKSVFSDTYTSIATNYNPNWGQSGAVNSTFVAVAGSGNNILAYTNFNYQGTDLITSPTPTNASTMEYLHIDVWSNTSGAVLKVSPINNGTGVGEFLVNVPLVSGSWNSVDLPKSLFTGMNWDSVFQLKFDGQSGTNPSNVYLDNIYFWKNPLNTAADASLSDLKVNGTTVVGFSAGVLTYTVESPANPLPVVAATPTQTTANAVVTQATAVPGSATVLVTSSNGTTKTYTVNFILPISPQVSATNPTQPSSDVVLSLFNDKPGYTNAYVPEGEFGTRTLVNLDAENDQTIKMDFSVAGWGQYDNTPPSVATANYLHFSYFAANIPAGVNGHGFYIMLNSGNGEKYFTVKPTGGNATMVLGSWQTVSIPMSHFTNQGFNPASLVAWKLGTNSDLNTKLVWFDNIFFTQSVLGTKDLKTNSSVKMYPNPVKAGEVLTIVAEVKEVSIYNMVGQKLLSTDSSSISTRGLRSGNYLVQTTLENGSMQISKLIVE